MVQFTVKKVIYVPEPEKLVEQQQLIPRLISRRGIELGWIAQAAEMTTLEFDSMEKRWKAAEPVVLAGFLSSDLHRIQGDIEQTETLVQKILDGEELGELVTQDPCQNRLSGSFELVASLYNESDDQEIEKLEFAAVMNRRTLADDLWVKVAWLSFFDEDPSLRFRFSFGVENYEDVAADLRRERLAAGLCDAIFPESSVLTENRRLRLELAEIIGISDLEYVERIVYFNGPQGGAQFHHDVERGHLGVIFAQLTGQTAWLALSTDALLAEVRLFLESADGEQAIAACPALATAQSLRRYRNDPELLGSELHDPNNDALEILLNQVPQFFAQLVRHGHGYMLAPGDVLLLPQQSPDHCAWHSVFCVGDEMGEGLSFAIREVG